jgi:hypothetical protein
MSRCPSVISERKAAAVSKGGVTNLPLVYASFLLTPPLPQGPTFTDNFTMATNCDVRPSLIENDSGNFLLGNNIYGGNVSIGGKLPILDLEPCASYSD